MAKYKICKFVNGNGKEWYQILRKGWIFWSYISSYEYFGIEVPPLRTILRFDNIEKAKHHISMIEQIKNSRIIKKVECFDYV